MVDVCSKYGTPLFVFDEAALRKNFRMFQETISKYYRKTLVCYSIKTNYNPIICEILREEGAYAAAASGLDMHVAEKAGYPPECVILDGLYKSKRELEEAVRSHLLLINVESFSELELLDKVAAEAGVVQDIGIRVNFTQSQGFKLSKAIFCYPSSRFGFSMEDASLAFKRATKSKNLRTTGIMAHPYNHADRLLRYARRVQDEMGIRLQYVNFGGGFGKNPTLSMFDLTMDFFREKLGFRSKLDRERKGDMLTRMERIGKVIAEAVKQNLGSAEPTIVFEPGRGIVGDAGILLVEVKSIKEAAGRKWVIVNGGTNLIPDYWERREIRVVNNPSSTAVETVNVVGPLLYRDDFIAIKKLLPKVQEGDILVVLDSGAYSLSQSTQFLYPRPAAILIDLDGKPVVIRKKEDYEDLLKMDREV